ncbi:hypothetical protein [Motiliproteus sediminis]|uniref:hypothetical protein n=1 Tax=Motiliproteus sediminis TaxID=1468178 RepID=UPI001AEFD62C|nr:hypothetical protein [Motiliproteus sediminis]
MRSLLWLALSMLITACSPPQTAQEPPPAVETGSQSPAEFGICYDANGCSTGTESWYSVTRSQCRSVKGSSWKGPVSGCVNF